MDTSKELKPDMLAQVAEKKTFLVEVWIDKSNPEQSAAIAQGRLMTVSGVNSVTPV